MIQFYFLSILFNLMAGYTLVYSEPEKLSATNPFSALIQNETVKLLLGVLTFISGFLKILSSVRGDIPVIGDILPALCGLAAGFTLLLDYFKSRSTLAEAGTGIVYTVFHTNAKWIGIAAIISAVLHFVFPTVLLL